MEVAVWDTYVTKKDGRVMHFDIIVPKHIKDEKIIFGYGCEYLKSKNEEGQSLTARECRFCHIEIAAAVVEAMIQKQGYYILEIQNCN